MSIKLLKAMVIAGLIFLAISCGKKRTEVAFETITVLCPEVAVTCDECDDLTFQREVQDLIGIEEQSLDLFEKMTCLERCNLLKEKAREICEEKFQNEED